MALSPQEQKVLEDLLARQTEAEPRTDTGLKGVLHALIDVASGAVPHLSADRWAELRRQAEGHDQDQPAPQDAAGDDGDSSATEAAKTGE